MSVGTVTKKELLFREEHSVTVPFSLGLHELPL